MMSEPERKPQLMYFDGLIQREIALTHTPFSIGRLPDRDLVLSAPFISRQHASIVEEDGGYVLRDQGSRSGCYVNGSRVERHLLSDRDVIQVGSLEGPQIQFRLDNGTATSLRTLLGHVKDGANPQSSLSKLSWFLAAARRLNDLGAVSEILSALIESTVQLTRVERGFAFMRSKEGVLEFALGRNAANEPLADDGTISRSAMEQSLESKSGFIITDTQTAEDWENSPSIMAHSLRTVICIPLRSRTAKPGEPYGSDLGVLYLDSRQQRNALTAVDSNLLNAISSEAAMLVENAILAQAEEAGRQYRAELQVASGIQKGLMAVRLPHLDYAQVDAESLPCKEIGGDFFDVLEQDGELSVVVADVSGKGVSAALLGAMLQGLVHAKIVAGEALEAIACSANEFICARELGKYATMVLLRLSRSGQVTYMNCGHVRPIVQSATELRTLENGNLPVGLMAGGEYASERFEMKPGERILIMTDGMTEAENASGECYGDARLEHGLRGNLLLLEMMEEVRQFVRGKPLDDDCTALEVRFSGGSGSTARGQSADAKVSRSD